ncbi:Uncharacterized protein TCM_037253 [Theobroma cacao]|uniref:Uncharacterized protein n=1 Tax=Theobroma cacao TaxID=3641 RepID=A0A061GJY2_THECC|nr:Uncharacterized protein TCM_037253 [Theobroma cacao]
MSCDKINFQNRKINKETCEGCKIRCSLLIGPADIESFNMLVIAFSRSIHLLNQLKQWRHCRTSLEEPKHRKLASKAKSVKFLPNERNLGCLHTVISSQGISFLIQAPLTLWSHVNFTLFCFRAKHLVLVIDAPITRSWKTR